MIRAALFPLAAVLAALHAARAGEPAPTPASSSFRVPGAEAEKPGNPPTAIVVLREGSRLAGTLEPAAFAVETEYGGLSVPLERVRTIRFGREKSPGFSRRISKMVALLGSPSADESAKALADLRELGLQAYPEVKAAEKDDDPEVRDKARELAAEMEERIAGGERPPLDLDEVATGEFTAVGRVRLEKASLAGPYGTLSIPASEIAEIHGGASEEVRAQGLSGGRPEVCRRRLERVGRALDLFAVENGGHRPADLDELALAGYLRPEEVRCDLAGSPKFKVLFIPRSPARALSGPRPVLARCPHPHPGSLHRVLVTGGAVEERGVEDAERAAPPPPEGPGDRDSRLRRFLNEQRLQGEWEE